MSVAGGMDTPNMDSENLNIKKFRIKFKHTVEETYTAIIEADTKDEALSIFDDGPFDHLENEESEDSQGLNIEIIDVEEE